ncbi:(deoxy)nucleoside triphosphate pyrophosphohydrolase [Actinophytocola sp.]|uniref:(deoxy)nucleoside triphosphate pyrophosphohydrolase n=1 Tax=Actinophytocola sp. TaxID=1872138 RepID=UPI00389A436B
MTSAFVPAPQRVVSAALPSLAPGDEVGRLRVVRVEVDGWSAVAVRGRPLRLEVRLAPVPGGTLVMGPSELVAEVRARALALVGAPVIVGTAIVRGRALLAQQRSYPVEAAGLWELPGGRVEPGESDVDAVVRECWEELGVEVAVGGPIGPDVALPRGKLLRIYRAALVDPHASPHPHDHAALRWLKAGELGSVEWLPADRVLLPALRQALRTPACPTPTTRVSNRTDP